MTIDYFIIISFNALFGGVLGSFATVIIHRLPQMVYNFDNNYTLFLPRSHCPNCRSILQWWQNIPLLSWLYLRGKCFKCQVKISLIYILTELLFMLASIIFTFIYGDQLSVMVALLLFLMLWCLAIIDLTHQILPDALTGALLWSGLICCMIGVGNLNLERAVTGAIAGWVSLWMMYWLVYYCMGKEGMGYGDIKLFAGLGAWNGWELLPQLLFVATCLTLLCPLFRLLTKQDNWKNALPFGPGLAASGGGIWLVNQII